MDREREREVIKVVDENLAFFFGVGKASLRHIIQTS